ncbi:hypothetical protein [Streptomyces marispadix]|uniref:Uncharacterized protein n=1 Tax=Streptomyces marispadix TaxID=2922868 RepID=A0ABS9T4F4_9ACTN|nr:hypothetical protein [Streptomyces marispadix]MCH6163161.1 hypothetical protein [Streptomyces marispadix]
MTTQAAESGASRAPLIPQPALTREALREAVRYIKPLNLSQYDRELGEAFDQAVRTESIGWTQGFLIKWATFIAVERWPERAADLRAAEQVTADPSASEEQIREAQTRISRILADAEREIER